MFTLLAGGQPFGFREDVAGAATACEAARHAARGRPGVEHQVLREGRLYAGYTLVGTRLVVRMP